MICSQILLRTTLAITLIGGASNVLAQDTIPKMNIRFAHFGPSTWGSAKADQLFAKELESRTGGSVKTRFFWNGSLGGPMELPELASSGAIELASVVPPYFPAQWPLFSVLQSLPLVWSDPAVAMETEAYLLANNAAIKEEFVKNRLQPILIHGLPPYRLQCTSPIRNLEDLKGKRIRTFGEWPPYIFKKLGAIPVNLPLGEVYEGLQRGTLDCGYNPIENAGFLKLQEVAKYWSDINFGAIASYSAMTGADRYAKWSVSLKSAIHESAEVATSWEKQNFAQAEAAQIAAIKNSGVEFIKFSEQAKLNDLFPNMLETWQEKMCETTDCEKVKSVVTDIKKSLTKVR